MGTAGGQRPAAAAAGCEVVVVGGTDLAGAAGCSVAAGAVGAAGSLCH